MLGLNRVSYAVGLTTWFDIAPEGVTKASALERLRLDLDIDPSRVFAAGDGENDIQMLQWAGRRGDSVAMGQADAVSYTHLDVYKRQRDSWRRSVPDR